MLFSACGLCGKVLAAGGRAIKRGCRVAPARRHQKLSSCWTETALISRRTPYIWQQFFFRFSGWNLLLTLGVIFKMNLQFYLSFNSPFIQLHHGSYNFCELDKAFQVCFSQSLSAKQCKNQ